MEREPFARVHESVRRSKLTAGAHETYGFLAQHAGNHTGAWFGKQERIAADTGTHIRTVKRAVRELAGKGWVVVFPTMRRDRHNGFSVYVLPRLVPDTFENPAAVATEMASEHGLLLAGTRTSPPTTGGDRNVPTNNGPDPLVGTGTPPPAGTGTSPQVEDPERTRPHAHKSSFATHVGTGSMGSGEEVVDVRADAGDQAVVHELARDVVDRRIREMPREGNPIHDEPKLRALILDRVIEHAKTPTGQHDLGLLAVHGNGIDRALIVSEWTAVQRDLAARTSHEVNRKIAALRPGGVFPRVDNAERRSEPTMDTRP